MTPPDPPPDNSPPPDKVAADTAALAANSAQRAADAAAAAVANAEIAAAGVAHQAAESISESEQRFAQWESDLGTQRAELSELKNRLENQERQTGERFSQILQRLEPPPENRTNLNPEPDGKTRQPTAPPPPEPEKPPRRKAHNWM